MIWHFDSKYSQPRYWINESKLRQEFIEKRCKRIQNLIGIPKDIKNDYEVYRLAIRKIASNTNERTLISAIIPPNSLTGNSLSVNFPFQQLANSYNNLRYSNDELLVLCAILNSFVADYVLRARMTTNLNLFYLYQLPVPFIIRNTSIFNTICKLASRLVCTTPEFDGLAKSVGLNGYQDGATDPEERARLRAELDAIVAHLYGLDEEEFTHVLSTFPIVKEEVKQAAMRELLKSGSI
jgi:hypothetical protein